MREVRRAELSRMPGGSSDGETVGAGLRSRSHIARSRPSLWQRAYDHVLNDGTVSSIVQFDVRTPKDSGCNASRDKGLHLEILVSRNDRRELRFVRQKHGDPRKAGDFQLWN
jgi:hypothetical protein